MQLEIQLKLQQDPKMANYLKQNSEWYKYLNRNPLNYNNFVKTMKEQYKIRTTDKIGEIVDNIDLVSNILNVLK
jgi:hypothetical protein